MALNITRIHVPVEWRISSCSLVNSRAHTHARSAPRPSSSAARSRRVSSILWGASYSAATCEVLSMSAILVFLALPFAGMKPKNVKGEELKPDTESAAMSALGPGMGCALIPSLAQAAANSVPGSLIPGVPASDTTARLSPLLNKLISPGTLSRWLCSW